MNRICVAAAMGAAWALATALPAAAADPDIRFTTGVDWTTGDYGQSRSTDVLLVPLTAKLYAGKWTFRASTSWLSVTGPANIGAIDEDGGGGTDVTGTPGNHRNTRQGLGDSYFAAKYSFDHLGGGPAYFDVQGKVRAPTGSAAAGLGVGATDFIVDGELGADWKTRGAYVDIGRRFLGDPANLVRQDGWTYSAGGWAAFDKKTELGVWYFTRDPSIVGLDRPREIGAYVSRRIRGGWRAETYLSSGLSPASPDVGVGFTISYRPGFGRHRR